MADIHPLFGIVRKKNDCVDEFKQWIEQHPDVDIKTLKYDRSTIMWDTIIYDQENIFEYLITHHYDVNEIIYPEENTSILHMVVRMEQDRFIDIMMKHGGVNLNIQCSSGRTPLFELLATHRYCDLSLYMGNQLMSYGADPNIQDKQGKTVLFLVAAWRDHTNDDSRMAILLKHGADIHNRDKEGKTVLEHSCSNMYALKYFLIRKVSFADISEEKLKETFFLTARYAYPDVMKLLLDRFDTLVKLVTSNTDRSILDHLPTTRRNDGIDTERKIKTYQILLNLIEKANNVIR